MSAAQIIHLNNYGLVKIVCWAREGCAQTFAISTVLYGELQRSGTVFHCPLGHRLRFGKSVQEELEATRNKLEWAERDRDLIRQQRDHQERRAASAKGHATRLRKRIAAGQCPCCSETFANVAEHIAKKHPKCRPEE